MRHHTNTPKLQSIFIQPYDNNDNDIDTKSHIKDTNTEPKIDKNKQLLKDLYGF